MRLRLLVLSLPISILITVGTAGADLVSVADHYRQRYGVGSVLQDYVRHENLSQVRYMKVALDGVLYWGGGRYGSNPLGSEALQGLCTEGFSSAVYVYKPKGKLRGVQCDNGSLDYLHIPYSSKGNYSALKNFLSLVKQRIDNPDGGPIYLHCWNGIHASSHMAAVALIQFCGLSHEQAVRVFEENSRGTSDNYPHVARGISNFQPYDNLSLSDEQRRVVCKSAYNSF